MPLIKVPRSRRSTLEGYARTKGLEAQQHAATAQSIYGPARHRNIDPAYAAALADAGASCQQIDGSRPKSAERPVAPGQDDAKHGASGPLAARSMPNIVLAFHGELDISSRHVIEKELGRIERLTPAAVVIVDLSDVAYLDTTFLNALMRTQRHVRANGENRLHIVAPAKSFVSRVFAIAKLDATFKLFDDISSAQRYIARL